MRRLLAGARDVLDAARQTPFESYVRGGHVAGSKTGTRVRLASETAYATAYRIQTSADGSSWSTARSVTGGNGGADDITGLSASTRYVRMYGTARGTPYGYSLFTFEVHGG